MSNGEDAILFYGRLLNSFLIHPRLGPLLTIMKNMTRDVLSFIFILILLMFGFGVCMYVQLYDAEYHAVMTPSQWIYFVNFMALFGQFPLDNFGIDNRLGNIQNITECKGLGDVYPDIDCPRSTSTVAKGFLGLYLIIADIMLINLLIAMMNSSYSAVQDVSTQVWRTQRYFLVKEFEEQLGMVPPLNVIIFLYTSVMTLLGRRKKSWKQRTEDKLYKINLLIGDKFATPASKEEAVESPGGGGGTGGGSGGGAPRLTELQVSNRIRAFYMLCFLDFQHERSEKDRPKELHALAKETHAIIQEKKLEEIAISKRMMKKSKNLALHTIICRQCDKNEPTITCKDCRVDFCDACYYQLHNKALVLHRSTPYVPQ